MLKMSDFFMIKIEKNHTCGVPCKDIKSQRITIILIKGLIRDEV